jgi:hypothetical protein
MAFMFLATGAKFRLVFLRASRMAFSTSFVPIPVCFDDYEGFYFRLEG